MNSHIRIEALATLLHLLRFATQKTKCSNCSRGAKRLPSIRSRRRRSREHPDFFSRLPPSTGFPGPRNPRGRAGTRHGPTYEKSSQCLRGSKRGKRIRYPLVAVFQASRAERDGAGNWKAEAPTMDQNRHTIRPERATFPACAAVARAGEAEGHLATPCHRERARGGRVREHARGVGR